MENMSSDSEGSNPENTLLNSQNCIAENLLDVITDTIEDEALEMEISYNNETNSVEQIMENRNLPGSSRLNVNTNLDIIDVIDCEEIESNDDSNSEATEYEKNSQIETAGEEILDVIDCDPPNSEDDLCINSNSNSFSENSVAEEEMDFQLPGN